MQVFFFPKELPILRSRHYLSISRLLSLAGGNKWPANSLIGVKFFVYVALEQRAYTCPVVLWRTRYCPSLLSNVFLLAVDFLYWARFINYVYVGDGIEVRP